ncbi:MAG: DUF1800 domain-containing protein [Marinicaulis sp.]|nr:DUF1800 domain-containing protein [Marinicaulis sp.]NNL88458.1 DUF1800 domain-containing protein [Marinicaulis sp.]
MVAFFSAKRLSFNLVVASCTLMLAACGSPGDGSSAPTTAATPPATTPPPGNAATSEEASRFLSQATFGAADAEINRVTTTGFSVWISEEFAKPHESLLEDVLIAEAAGEDVGPNQLSETFWTRAIQSDDQLRQRVGYALSQILVASFTDSGLVERPIAMANYMDIMSAGAFGNFRQTLENVTYSPAMAIYLTYLQNQKASADGEVVPDENYAREVMQLFTIGLLELQPNGDLRLDGSGDPIETYDNDDVTELAKVFTGLSWNGESNFFTRRPSDISSEYLPLVMFDSEHSTDAKNFLNASIPPNTPGDASIDMALDALFNHQNTPPFISRQLIQRLVTSNPSSAYVGRVATAFRTGSYTMPNGTVAGGGGRGDMRAVVAAILLDDEARNAANMSDPNFGKVREPVLRFTHWARAFGVTETDIDEVDALGDTRAPNRLNQQAYRSPSVFNFYRPGFVSPGSVSASMGLVAPELQITTASSVTGYANFIEDFIFGNVPDNDFLPNYGPELALANDPAALVDRLDRILTYGSLRPATRARITQAVQSITGGAGGLTRDELRVRAAILFFMTSSDYTVSR